MINKILIANRGEIASRIIRTCNRLGIKTVAVYSEVDQTSPFVVEADESYLLGPANVRKSYLNVDKVLSIAKRAGVDAIHPGYGFLSESGSFADRCEEAGFIFIGPKSKVMNEMGNKIAARNLMEQAGLPVVPGTNKPVNTQEGALKYANAIGYPIMLKASAGGGGIGMQLVQSDEELKKAFTSNSTRAENFFGDGTMFLEKKLDDVRHIEIQILADEHGNVVHLFERECSIQRRNQKVIEEAPASFISTKTREKMGQAAVNAAKTIGYSNAGTIEFLVDRNEKFYFLEMNTRIQVEHTVTEEITGIDIVEEQLSIANGNELSIDQQSIKIDGHAIEVRIYAEDPETFFPSPGYITKFDVPMGKHIRNEITVTNNYNVTPFYDPMISKLIVKGTTRKEAIELLKQSLVQYKVKGIKTNIPMLINVVNNSYFQAGDITTSFIENHYMNQFRNPLDDSV